MHSIQEINLLEAQNIGYRNQNKNLQLELLRLKKSYSDLKKKYNELSKNDLLNKLKELKIQLKVERIRNRNLMKKIYSKSSDKHSSCN
nr:MAG TPA: hypothetical protein [Caudoviricetes sp.]